MGEAERDALFQELARQETSLRRYQGIVRVRGRGPEGSFDARLVVIFERPDRLRVELLGAFGGTRWSAVADEAGIVAYFPGDEHYVREPDVADVVGRLLGIELSARDVMALLTGVGAPVAERSPEAAYHRGAFGELELEGAELIVNRAAADQVVSAVTPRYRARYDGSWKANGRQFPRELVVENASVRVRIEAEDVDANTALAPEAFQLDVPEGALRLRPAEVEGQAVFVLTREPGR